MEEELHASGRIKLSTPPYNLVYCRVAQEEIPIENHGIQLISNMYDDSWVSLQNINSLADELEQITSDIYENEDLPHQIIGTVHVSESKLGSTCMVCQETGGTKKIIQFREQLQDPYIHYSCKQEFIETINTVIEDYSGDLVLENI